MARTLYSCFRVPWLHGKDVFTFSCAVAAWQGCIHVFVCRGCMARMYSCFRMPWLHDKDVFMFTHVLVCRGCMARMYSCFLMPWLHVKDISFQYEMVINIVWTQFADVSSKCIVSFRKLSEEGEFFN